MPSLREGSARGVSGGGARLLDIRYADQAEALPIADSRAQFAVKVRSRECGYARRRARAEVFAVPQADGF